MLIDLNGVSIAAQNFSKHCKQLSLTTFRIRLGGYQFAGCERTPGKTETGTTERVIVELLGVECLN